MKVYEFRLAAVERIRVLEAKLAREKLVTSLRNLREAQAANEVAHRSLRSMAGASGVVAPSDLLWLDDQRERLAESLRLCGEKMVQAQMMTVDAKAEWGAATKRATMLERLDARSHAAWREAALRSEVAESDDLTIARFRVAGAGE